MPAPHPYKMASKISLNPEYLWTERGPEMHDGISQASNGELETVGLSKQARSLINGRFEVVSMSQLVPATRTGRATPAGRRSREAARRGKRVEFTLTDGEFADLDTAAQLAGLSRGAYAAQAALAVARGGGSRAGVPLREALVELMTAAGLVRRVGTNLNQAVARLNATGQRGDDLLPAAQFCMRVIRRLDEAAEHVRRNIP
jgi:hypothetical protein